jgi:CubicO group peptidase (beta-lactamase class C family)
MLTDTLDRLDRLVDRQVFCTGAQLYVEGPGGLSVNEAFGECAGRPVRVDSLHSAFCLTKPLLPLAIAWLVDDGLVSFDDEVGQHADLRPVCEARTTLRQLLSHGAGLGRPTASEWRMTAVDARMDLLASYPTSADKHAYSELAAGFVLGRMVEVHRGCDAAAWITQRILSPLALADDVVVEPALAVEASHLGRVLVPVGGLPDEQIPLLSEQLPGQLRESAAYFGGLASMVGIGRLYGRLCSVLNGERIEGLPSPGTLAELLECRRGRNYDAILNRSCDFAGGFMVGLVDHGITRLATARAIAHSAGFTNAVGLADPEHGIALGLYLNGVVLDPDELAYARMSIVDGVFREVREARA